MAEKNPQELQSFLETGDYIYRNHLTSWFTYLGHYFCAYLRRYDTSNETIVDLGCGDGSHFPFIKRAKIIGIDLLPEMLSKAENKFPGRAELRQEDILSLSTFPDHSVNSIISFGTLEHINPLNQALKQISRILSSRGEFIFGIPTEGIIYRIGRYFTTKRYIEKKYGIDYIKLLKIEHVNESNFILNELQKYFIIDKLIGVPFMFPNIHINIFTVGRCFNKPVKY